MIRNITRKTILSENETYCVSAGANMHGLMFSDGSAFRKGKRAMVLVFNKTQRIALHMWFVFYPIDVVFTDEHYEIVDIKQDFLPFTFYTSAKRAAYAVELPAGTAKRTKTKVEDVLSFSSPPVSDIR